MRKLSIIVLLTIFLLSLGVALAQEATPEATPEPAPTMTPTPLPPREFASTAGEIAGDSDNFAGVDPTGQTITYWHQFNNPTQLSIITGLVNAFNASNPYGITVNAIASGNYNDIRTKMNNGIVSGELPNIVAGFPNDALSYALDDVVVDLNSYVADAKWGFGADALADLNQVALESWNIDGVRLGIPNYISGEVMFTNAAMMEQLGFSPESPVTLDEFAEIACAAANSDLTGLEGAEVQGFPIVANASEFEMLVAGIGGNIWADGQWNFTNEQSLRVLQMYHDLYEQGCAYLPAEAFGNTADWARALNPMAFSSSAGIAPTLRTVGDSGNLVTDWRVHAAPVNAEGDQPMISFFTPGIMIVSGTPEQQVASWIFIRFFSQPDVQAEWSQALSLFPLSNSAAAMLDASAVNPQFLDMVNRVASGEVGVYVSNQVLSYNDVRAIVATGIADVTSNGMDPAEVAQRMTDEANALLE
jgi:multiple sugar transport system substrate-binding protein